MAHKITWAMLGKVKSACEPGDQSGRPSLSRSSMKRLGEVLLPPKSNARPSQGYPQHYVRRYPFIHLGEKRHCETVFSRNTTASPWPGLEPDHLIRRLIMRQPCFPFMGESVHELGNLLNSTEKNWSNDQMKISFVHWMFIVKYR